MNNKGINLSEEYRELVRYFRLSMLRNRGMLPPEGLKELEEIVRKNERAAAVESAWKEHEAGRLSDENYQLVHDTHRAALAEAIKNASQNEVEEKKPELSPEFADLARYFRLSILRNKGQLPPAGLQELEEILARNERAQAIEETRTHLLDGSIKPEDYEKVVAFHRAALAEEIKKTFGRSNESKETTREEEKKVEPKPDYKREGEEQARQIIRRQKEEEKKAELKPDYKREGEEQARQIINKEINNNNNKNVEPKNDPNKDNWVPELYGQIFAQQDQKDTNKEPERQPEPKEEPKKDDNWVPELYGQIFAQQDKNNINNYEKTDHNNLKEPIPDPYANKLPGKVPVDNNNIDKERLNKIKETIDKNLNNKVPNFNNQESTLADNKKLLSDLRKAINDIQKEEKITPETTMFKPQQQNSVDISDEYRSLARYFRLSILRNNGQLPPAGLEELDQIVSQNERAAAVEEARKQMEAGNLSKEGYQKVHDVQRAALAEAIINASGPAPEMEPGRRR